MFNDDAIARREMMDKLAEVQQYRGHELYAAFVHLLGLIDDSYNADLRSVDESGLRMKQGGARQCAVLREALLRGDNSIMPKV